MLYQINCIGDDAGNTGRFLNHPTKNAVSSEVIVLITDQDYGSLFWIHDKPPSPCGGTSVSPASVKKRDQDGRAPKARPCENRSSLQRRGWGLGVRDRYVFVPAFQPLTPSPRPPSSVPTKPHIRGRLRFRVGADVDQSGFAAGDGPLNCRRDIIRLLHELTV